MNFFTTVVGVLQKAGSLSTRIEHTGKLVENQAMAIADALTMINDQGRQIVALKSNNDARQRELDRLSKEVAELRELRGMVHEIRGAISAFSSMAGRQLAVAASPAIEAPKIRRNKSNRSGPK